MQKDIRQQCSVQKRGKKRVNSQKRHKNNHTSQTTSNQTV
jgi:hypothetical protein